MLARVFLALTLAVGFVADEAAALEFTFTGQCDDCAFGTEPGDPEPGDEDFDALDDGLFQAVTGTLTLENVTPGSGGVIDVGSENFVSFSYAGSSLLNPFVFTDPFTITGQIDGAGNVLQDLIIETSAGDFSNFCTALGEQVLDGGAFCEDFGIAYFELTGLGDWSVSGSEAFDVGVGGGLAAVPEPAGVWLAFTGFLGLAAARSR